MLVLTKDPVKTKSGTIATIAELKTQLNIPVEFTDDDTLLTDLLDIATETVEDDTHSDILNVANLLEHDNTDIQKNEQSIQSIIHIYQAPVNDVSKIEKYTGGEWAEIPATDYKIVTKFTRVEIFFNTTHTAEKIRFTFSTGFEDAKRPKKLKQAVILKAADLYGVERSDYATTAVTSVKTYNRLLNKHVRNYV